MIIHKNGGDNGKVSHTRILRDSRDYMRRMVQVRRTYGKEEAIKPTCPLQ